MNLINDDVVISGIGGHFPKSTNIAELAKNLFANEDLLESRWKEGERGVSNKIGKIAIDYFDNAYFGIHRQQSFFMDPMQRLILERTFEALIDAGVNPNDIKGRRIGVYMGSSVGENDNLFLESIVSGFGITGHSRAMMPNRVSYWLNLKGPSVAYDSNWVGGMEVIRLAFDAIRTGQCEAAIVGTANLALNCEMQWIYDDMGLLSREGTTRAFDVDAAGYTRSDGVVCLYLQRASEAKRSYATILKANTCFNAPPTGNILQASAEKMIEFLEEFYEDSPVPPEKVEFVEAYGCGLKDTDRQEVEALEKIYCKNRKNPLLIGSIKTNTGHSEASAVLFSVAKVLIAMETGTIPANLYYDKPNPEISALVKGTVEVVKENKKWDGEYAAVNAIGLDSYYGHLLLKSNNKKKVEKKDDLPRLLLVSTRTEEGIKNILETVKTKPRDNPEYFALLQELFSKPILGHLYRGYAILGEEDKFESEYHLGNKRQIWFVYSGMGSQWCGMVSDLMKIEVFAKAINKCASILKPKGVDLMDILTNKDPKTFDNILHSFVGIAAMQIGLTDVLHAMGIVPDGIIGHSVGELGCAYADGCLTAEQMILSAYSRGKASLEATLIKGMMAAVGMGYNQIKDRLPASIEVACHNGPDSSTISGPTEDMEKFVKQLQDEGVFARLVNVANIAYHSRYIKPAAPLLLQYLKEVIPEAVERSPKWVSTSNLEENWNTDLAKHSSPEYHTNNLLSSVLFEEGLKHIPKDSILIEIAPHGLLQAILKRSLKSGCTNIPLTNRGSKSAVDFLLTNLGKMYLAGMDLNVSALYPKVEYPVSKGTSTLSDLVHWNHTDTWRTGLEGKQINFLYGLKDLQVTLNSEDFRECVGHQFDDQIILPFGYYLNIVYDLYSSINPNIQTFIFENLYVRNILSIPKIGSVPMHVMVLKGSGDFEIISNKELLLSGRIYAPQTTDKYKAEVYKVEFGEDNVQLSGSDVYSELQHRGHKYSGQFKALKNLILTEEGSVSQIQWAGKWHIFLEGIIQQHILLSGERNQEGRAPKTIQKIVVSLGEFPAEKSDLEVTYNYSTGVLSTDGVQVISMVTTPLTKNQMNNYFDSLEITPLNNVTFTSLESGLNTAIQLTLDNSDELYVTNIVINEIETNNPSLIDNVKEVLSHCKRINSSIEIVKEPKQIIVQETFPLLLIYNDYINSEVAKLLQNSHGFLLVRSDKSILNYKNIVQVSTFTVNNISYSVLRSRKEVQPHIIFVKGDTLTAKDLNRSSVNWVTELNSAIQSAKDSNQSVFLISTILPTEGYLNFVHELRSVPNMTNLRVLFVPDKKVNEINVKDPIYQNIFQQDLYLTIVKDNSINAYLPIPLPLKDNVSNNFHVTNNIVKNVNVNYIGINVVDETMGVKDSNKKEELGNIDYSGVTTNGQRVMGFATWNRETSKLNADSILQWEVPEKMTIEDAATIPNAYVCAYYALYVKGDLKPGETVLVHAGYTAIGMACISLAMVNGCKVYTTVSTNWQRAYLKKYFAKLDDNCIFSSDNDNFGPQLLMATAGHGAEVIINCLSGTLLQVSFNCLASYGRFIQIGKYDMEENNFIGMSVFLKNTSFIHVDFQYISELTKDEKKEIHDAIQDGLELLSVRPLPRKSIESQDISNILKELKNTSIVGKILIKVNNNVTLNKFNVNKPSQFICDAKSSYLVYGGNAEHWTDVAEWLILRGARKVVISSDSKPQQNHINRRLSLLQSYYQAEIIFAPSKAHTRENAVELLSEVYFLGPIHAVFLLPTKSSISRISEVKPIHYIDQVLRTTAPKAIFVNFVNAAAGICHLRAEAGFCTYNVQMTKDVEFGVAMNGLDDILSYKVKNILVKDDRESDTKQESTQSLYRRMTQLLPPSADYICNEVKEAPEEPELTQLTTLGPREMRELIPIFLVPGLNGQQQFDELALELMYPAFGTVLPSKVMPLNQLAEIFATKIKEVWPKGPYNIVGISWGGPLAIQIARILNKGGATTHMYFIDSTPNTIQSAIKQLGEDKNVQEVNLITRLFNISDTDVIKKIKECKNWNDRLNFAIETTKFPASNRKFLDLGIEMLQKRLHDASVFQPNDELITGKVFLIRSSESNKYDSCGLTAYCKSVPEIHLVKGDHLSIINSKETAEIGRAHV